MPALLKEFETQDVISALCARFTILTVARTKESTACRWSEVDLAAKTRSVQILKGGQAWQHVVPLSDQAIELLKGLMVEGKPAGEYVFPARNRRGHLGTSAMLDLLKRLKWNDRTWSRGARPFRELLCCGRRDAGKSMQID